MFATAVALEEEYFTVQACKGLQSEGVHLFWTEGQGTSLDDLAGGAVRWGWGGGGSSCQCPLSRIQVHNGGLANSDSPPPVLSVKSCCLHAAVQDSTQ